MWTEIILTFLDAKRIEERFSRIYFVWKKNVKWRDPIITGEKAESKALFLSCPKKSSMGQGGGIKYFQLFGEILILHFEKKKNTKIPAQIARDILCYLLLIQGSIESQSKTPKSLQYTKTRGKPLNKCICNWVS